jgi:hypothetical protein
VNCTSKEHSFCSRISLYIYIYLLGVALLFSLSLSLFFVRFLLINKVENDFPLSSNQSFIDIYIALSNWTNQTFSLHVLGKMPECHSAELPILDISQPLQPSALASLAEACQEWGFFRISNHGISKELYNKLYSLSQQLFGLPAETKLELGPSSSINTYTPHFIASPFFECLRVFGPNFFASAQSSADTLFGQQSFEFR